MRFRETEKMSELEIELEPGSLFDESAAAKAEPAAPAAAAAATAKNIKLG